MKGSMKFMNEITKKYKLILLTEEYLEELYKWNIEEKHFQQYTCRPLKSKGSYDEYANRMLNLINNSNQKNYILIDEENCNKPLGKIQFFDYNPRNFSAEFGYYLPENNRNKGVGSIMIEKFLDIAFKDSNYNLNKLYATTASNNNPSIKLLNKFGFKLDGRLREHYWIDGKKYDQCVYSILRREYLM
jgi:RimJ/RimL family protein N-acetyltransferase